MTRLTLLLLALGLASTALAQDLRLVLPIGHTQLVRKIAVRDCNNHPLLVASNGQDKKLKILSGDDLKELLSLEGSGYPWIAEFSPCGSENRLLASFGAEESQHHGLRIWHLDSLDVKGEPHHIDLGYRKKSILDATFSNDGSQILLIGRDSTLCTWNPDSGILEVIYRFKEPVSIIELNHDGRLCMVKGTSGFTIFDLKRGVVAHRVQARTPDWMAPHWSPVVNDVVFYKGDSVCIFNVGSNQIRHICGLKDLNASNRSWRGVSFMPNGEELLIVHTDEFIIGHPDDLPGSFIRWKYPINKIDTVDSYDHRTTSMMGGSPWIGNWEALPMGERIFTSSEVDLGVWAWDLQGNLIPSDDHDALRSGPIKSTVFLGEENKVASASRNIIHVWDFNTGKPVETALCPTNHALLGVAPCPDSGLGFAWSHEAVFLWMMRGPLNPVKLGSKDFALIGHVEAQPSGEHLLISAMDILHYTELMGDSLHPIWSLELANRELKVEQNPVRSDIVFAQEEKEVMKVEMSSGLVTDTIMLDGLNEYWVGPQATYGPDGRVLLYTAFGQAMVSNSEMDSTLHHWPQLPIAPFTAKFSPSGDWIAFAGSQWQGDGAGACIIKVDHDSGANRWIMLEGHSEPIRHVTFSPDSKYIITSSDDHTSKIWSAKDGSLLYTRMFFENGGWLAWDPEYRFDGSKEAIDLMYFACGLEAIGLEQAPELWTPNLVSRIMTSDPTLDKEATLSSLDLCGRAPSVKTRTAEDDEVVFEIESGRSEVSGFDVFINGRKFKELPATEVASDDGRYLLEIGEEEIQRHALDGEDGQVEVSVVARTTDNVNSRQHTSMVFVPIIRNDELPSFHGVFVGINDYKYDVVKDLNYAAADAKAMSEALSLAAGRYFGEENVYVTTLVSDYDEGQVNRPPTLAALRNVLDSLAEHTRPRDVLFLHFSGHGKVNPDNRFVFLTFDSQMEQDGSFTGLSWDDLDDYFVSIPASNRIMVLDACNSGGLINDMMGDAVAYVGEKDNTTEAQKSARKKQMLQLGKENNLTLLTACASGQKAYEGFGLDHGLLTFALLDAIKNHVSVLDEESCLLVEPWIERARKTVTNRVSQMGNTDLDQQTKLEAPDKNYCIGLVDAAVRDKVHIEEKQVIGYVNWQWERFPDLAIEKGFEDALSGANAERVRSLDYIEEHPKGLLLMVWPKPNGDGTYSARFEVYDNGQQLTHQGRILSASGGGDIARQVAAALGGQ